MNGVGQDGEWGRKTICHMIEIYLDTDQLGEEINTDVMCTHFYCFTSSTQVQILTCELNTGAMYSIYVLLVHKYKY